MYIYEIIVRTVSGVEISREYVRGQLASDRRRTEIFRQYKVVETIASSATTYVVED